mmetsp:Transcript_37537/g.54961  ORF Transcript_37537/g.54961 Transcript_37537/m.54961 type:complete len:662 (+) Transcript_37537:236-2221(+)
MFTTPPTENDPLVQSDSKSSIQDLAKSSDPKKATKLKGHFLLIGTVLALMACSSFAILARHSVYGTSREGVGDMSEVSKGHNNEMSETADFLMGNGLPFCSENSHCDSGEVCCNLKKTIPGVGTCKECCTNFDCFPRIIQPPAGEWGKPFCINARCQSNNEDEESGTTSPKIAKDGYQAWAPSESIDNSKEFRGYKIPRILHSNEPKPVMDQVWYVDFNEQRDDFPIEKISSNGTHIMIPIFEYFHSGYSKSYHQYNEHETGISTLVMGDNEYSLVSDYPKTSFVEKYHTLTYSGKKETTSRGDDFLDLSAKHKNDKDWNMNKWKIRALKQVIAYTRRKSIEAQVEGGIDRSVSWQIRRFVNSHKTEDTGKLNPSTSSAWASHTKKAKKAIEIAKDPNFKRELMKSEQHCKHLEDNPTGLDYTDTHVIIPLGVPITQFTGEIVNAPTHYLGLGVGYTTFMFDETSKVLQMYYQVHAISRQYPDVKYPGPYETGTALYVSPVAEGSDYDIDMSKESRSNIYLEPTQPSDELFVTPWSNADFALWNRPQSEICDPEIENGDWWENVDLSPGDENIWDSIGKSVQLLNGIAVGMLCAPIWMRADYGAGSHRFDLNEIGVWGHFLGEVRDEYTKLLGAANYWDNWECFYQNKDSSICEDRGLLGI